MSTRAAEPKSNSPAPCVARRAPTPEAPRMLNWSERSRARTCAGRDIDAWWPSVIGSTRPHWTTTTDHRPATTNDRGKHDEQEQRNHDCIKATGTNAVAATGHGRGSRVERRLLHPAGRDRG